MRQVPLGLPVHFSRYAAFHGLRLSRSVNCQPDHCADDDDGEDKQEARMSCGARELCHLRDISHTVEWLRSLEDAARPLSDRDCSGHANLSLGPSAWRVECGISCVKVKTLRRRPRRDRTKAGPPLFSRNSLYPVPARLLPCGLGRDRRPHANQPFAGSGTGRKDARSGLTGVAMAPRFRPDRLVRAQRQGAVGAP
jgi:hypothetical protein